MVAFQERIEATGSFNVRDFADFFVNFIWSLCSMSNYNYNYILILNTYRTLYLEFDLNKEVGYCGRTFEAAPKNFFQRTT